MAEMLIAAGFPLTVWTRRPEAAAPFVAQGAQTARDPRSFAAGADLLCLCVTADADVRELLLTRGMLAAMAPGSVVAIHSTISPETCRMLAGLAAARAVDVVDLPVSGSGHAARARKLLVLAGGTVAVIDRLRPVLAAYADTVVEMGSVGEAMFAKLINNLTVAAHIGVAWKAMTLGRHHLLSPHDLRRALLAGTGRSFAVDLLVRLEAPGRSAHIHAILAKDVLLGLKICPADVRDAWGELAQAGLDALAAIAHGNRIFSDCV